MPAGYNKPKWRVRPVFGLQAAGDLGNLVRVTCRGCRRTRYFLPADLLQHFGRDREVDDVRFTCPTCGTDQRVVVALHHPQPGDWGSLDVRRPLPPVLVVRWRTVKLGDEPK